VIGIGVEECFQADAGAEKNDNDPLPNLFLTTHPTHRHRTPRRFITYTTFFKYPL